MATYRVNRDIYNTISEFNEKLVYAFRSEASKLTKILENNEGHAVMQNNGEKKRKEIFLQK